MAADERASEPINYLHYCPHCGSGRFEARSAKEFLCGACGFNFFANSAAAVLALVRDRRGRLLLTRRARDPWAGALDLPGGFVDPGESAEDALRREMAEELGVRVTSMKYFCSEPNEYIFSNYKVHTTDLAFVCELDTMPTTASDDVSEALWMPPGDIDTSQIPLKSIRRIAERYIDSLRCARH